MITLKEYLTASGDHPERENSEELTQELLDNAGVLLDKVNNFLNELKDIETIAGTQSVSSGFRPSDVNKSIPGAALHSNHMICKAIDLKDKDGSLDEAVGKHPELLRKYGLWREDPSSTPNWCHLDYAVRADRPSRTFHP